MTCSSFPYITRKNGESELDYQIRLFYTFIQQLSKVDCGCMLTRINELLKISRKIGKSSDFRNASGWNKVRNLLINRGKLLSNKATLLAPLTGKIGKNLSNYIEKHVRTPIAQAQSKCSIRRVYQASDRKNQ